MNSAQWQEVWQIFNAARELPVDQQGSFVESKTGDPEIVRRVFEALAEYQEAADENPAASSAGREGTQVGRYQVSELLGRGGMGEVYAAVDVDLNRRVALKFLLPGALGDPAALKRFVREAKAASALNHPSILTIHEVIDFGSGLAIATELIEGKPLSECRGSMLPLRHVAEIGSQVAGALAAAHEHGIVHRDIKPENLMLRPDGFVKVLDFGLARNFRRQDQSAIASSVTGFAAGTLRYMSPEQLRNERLTGASDVFSLGIVLYELVTGNHPFEAAYDWEAAHAIHTRDPLPPSVANRQTPVWLDKLIHAMLHREIAKRPTANQVAAALMRERWDSGESATAVVSGTSSRYRIWAVCLVVAFGLVAAGRFFRDRLPYSNNKVVEFTRYPGNEDMPSFSPDGQIVAFVWNGPGQDNLDIYLRAVASTALQRLTTSPLEDYSPAWSPDGQSIAFIRKASNSGSAELVSVSARGGPERVITGLSLDILDTTASLCWTPDSKALIAPSRESFQDSVGLFLISAADGSKVRLTRPPHDQSDLAPAIGPGGRMLAFVRSHSESVHSIYLLPLTHGFLAGGEPQQLPTFPNLRSATPQWSPDGEDLLFAANPQTGMAIWRMRVPTPGAASAAPREEPFASRSFRIRIGAPSLAASRLMYSTELQERNIWRAPLTPGSPAVAQRVGPANLANAGADISPDGSRIVFESMRTGSTEVWVANIDGSQARQLTSFGGPVTGSAAWSPDGKRIAFDSRAEGRPHIYVVSADGSGQTRVTDVLAEHYLPTWSRDGKWIYFCSSRSGSVEVWRQPDGGGAAEQMTDLGGWAPVESTDGSALYYQRRIPGAWSLRRLTLSTRADEEVIPAMIERAYGVAPGGVYYVPLPGPDGRYSIHFLDLKLGVSRVVLSIQRPMTRRLAVSPDGSFLLYSQLDRWGQDLILVERFR